jgi:hypothetical protein
MGFWLLRMTVGKGNPMNHRSKVTLVFKRVIQFSLLFLMPIITVAQDEYREFVGYHWYDDGIAFRYPLGIAENALTRFIPASGDLPESVQIIFENYHGDASWRPNGAEIHIMPVSTLPDRLEIVLDTLEALPTLDNIEQQLSQIIQGQDTTANVTEALSLEFLTGRGVRFLALIQDTLDAVKLSYWYIGKTTDSQYLVVGRLPTSVSNLNLQTLENAGDFSPNLESLDRLIASLSITAPDDVFLTKQTNGQISCQGLHFDYDTSLAYRVERDYVAPIVGTEAEQTMFGLTPGYQRFTFVGFPAVGNIQSPQLFILPVSEFPDEQQIYSQRLNQLQTWLAMHPELKAAAEPGGQNPLPILPVLNAAQTIVSHPQYINFVNGEGLRYITFYSQGPEPITANDLFYSFAGISEDGNYVVAATFPLYAAFLPEGRTAYEIADYESFALNYQSYLDGLLLQIEVIDESAYTPQIQLLDALITSINVDELVANPTSCILETQ